MTTETKTPIRLASAADAPAFAELLHEFNSEFGESTPDADVIAARAAPLIESGEVTVLLAGEGPEGFAELRFRPSLYTGALDAYLEELYVVPEQRGQGLGRRAARGRAGPFAAARRRAHRPRHQRGRRCRPCALRELRIHQPRGRARRAKDALLRARPLVGRHWAVLDVRTLDDARSGTGRRRMTRGQMLRSSAGGPSRRSRNLRKMSLVRG